MASADLLLSRLDQLRTLRSASLGDALRRERLHRLTDWQAQRLARTHADLLANPRYRPAVRFFLTDLYGPMDFSQRDRKLERISPMLAKVLSENALHTMGLALEMNVVTEELDHAMEQTLVATGFPPDLTDEVYIEAYRRCGEVDRRRRQIDLIRQVGEDLDEIVTRPWIRRALQMARRPARLSGLGDLHEVLERGFEAFHGMRGAAEFLDTIVGRERRIMERIYEDHPTPFDLEEK
ncbi:MAG: hypothetical protein AAF657_05485 [Acidobacteriota bacterium]